jgi:acyl-coenzyme A thioesterase PaaI-like protein
MPLDSASVAAMLPQVVPMVGTLSLAIDDVQLQRAVLRLPDQAAYHNHLGGPHAGAMFTLAESASGALVLANYGDLLERVVPLAVEATIRYEAVAMGEVTAVATMEATAAEILARLDAGERPEFVVEIELTTPAGRTGSMTVRWTLKPLRRD